MTPEQSQLGATPEQKIVHDEFTGVVPLDAISSVDVFNPDIVTTATEGAKHIEATIPNNSLPEVPHEEKPAQEPVIEKVEVIPDLETQKAETATQEADTKVNQTAAELDALFAELIKEDPKQEAPAPAPQEIPEIPDAQPEPVPTPASETSIVEAPLVSDTVETPAAVTEVTPAPTEAPKSAPGIKVTGTRPIFGYEAETAATPREESKPEKTQEKAENKYKWFGLKIDRATEEPKKEEPKQEESKISTPEKTTEKVSEEQKPEEKEVKKEKKQKLHTVSTVFDWLRDKWILRKMSRPIRGLLDRYEAGVEHEEVNDLGVRIRKAERLVHSLTQEAVSTRAELENVNVELEKLNNDERISPGDKARITKVYESRRDRMQEDIKQAEKKINETTVEKSWLIEEQAGFARRSERAAADTATRIESKIEAQVKRMEEISREIAELNAEIAKWDEQYRIFSAQKNDIIGKPHSPQKRKGLINALSEYGKRTSSKRAAVDRLEKEYVDLQTEINLARGAKEVFSKISGKRNDEVETRVTSTPPPLPAAESAGGNNVAGTASSPEVDTSVSESPRASQNVVVEERSKNTSISPIDSGDDLDDSEPMVETEPETKFVPVEKIEVPPAPVNAEKTTEFNKGADILSSRPKRPKPVVGVAPQAAPVATPKAVSQAPVNKPVAEQPQKPPEVSAPAQKTPETTIQNKAKIEKTKKKDKNEKERKEKAKKRKEKHQKRLTKREKDKIKKEQKKKQLEKDQSVDNIVKT